MDLKTIAIRVEPALHQQLVLLAQLSGRPLAEEIRIAVDEHIARRGDEVDITAQAEAALAEIDRDAANRRKAIQSLLKKDSPGAAASTAKPRKGGKGGAQ